MTFDNGMRLLGHWIQESPGRSRSILYWRGDRKMDTSYKISLRFLDPSGKMMFQHDGIPQSWEHPTVDWVPGETVIDYYYLEPGAVCQSRCRWALLVYDEKTLQPVEAWAIAGAPYGPLIPLSGPQAK